MIEKMEKMRHLLLIILSSIVLMLNSSSCANELELKDYPPPCDSKIFCYGPILHTIRMSQIFNATDVRFLDLSLKKRPYDVETSFQILMNVTNGSPDRSKLLAFIDDTFDDKPAVTHWDPKDWKPNPEFLKSIQDAEYRKFGGEIHQIWKKLTRKVSEDVKLNQEKYTHVYVENPFIVPGGHFNTFYYWDSYWVMEGLLLSNMHKTVRGMLLNFLSMVERFGLVPNGGRTYYTRRSQPPYLIPMVKLYVDTTGDVDFLRKNINTLEKEFQFWEDQRMVNVTNHVDKMYRVAHYNVLARGPRAEGYRNDFTLAMDIRDEGVKQQLYRDILSACESGWDFSTRWFGRKSKDTKNPGSLLNLQTSNVAPVDLNSLLCYNARLLSQFHTKLGNPQKASQYKRIAAEKKEILDEFFWDKQDGIWHDFDIDTLEKRRSFYPSNFHPLWTGCYGDAEGTDDEKKAEMLQQSISYLKKSGVLDYVGGIPTSLKNSSQQWDYPDAWAPLQHHIIMALHQSADINEEARSIALSLASKWIRTNYEGFKKTGAIFEKYDATRIGKPGGGGEYKVVLGFGWTNGVALKLLHTFGDQLNSSNLLTHESKDLHRGSEDFKNESEDLNNESENLNRESENSINKLGQHYLHDTFKLLNHPFFM